MNKNNNSSCYCRVVPIATIPGGGYARRLARSGILAAAALLATAVAAPAQRAVTVKANTIQSLDAKLQSFAQGLAPSERAAWDTVLRQAASAPADNGTGIAVKPTFYGGSGSGAGAIVSRDAAGGIIVQGGRTNASGSDTRPSAFNSATVGRGGIDPRGGGDPAAIGPKQEDPARGGGRGAVSIGPKQEDPARGGGTGAVSIGPKQEDPARGGGGRGAVSIGPKQEDPTRGGGTGAVSIGPKQEDPTRGGGRGAVSIGPKQEDPTRGGGRGATSSDPLASLGEKMERFAGSLSGGEQATFDWLLQRASKGRRGGGGTMPVGPGGKPAGPAASREAETQRGPGGLPAGAAQTAAGQRNPGPGGMPGRAPSLGQALGQGSASTDVVLKF
jgi:hypothetical protein